MHQDTPLSSLSACHVLKMAKAEYACLYVIKHHMPFNAVLVSLVELGAYLKDRIKITCR